MGFREWWVASRAPLLNIAVDEGAGPPVILLHGIASSSSVTFIHAVPLLVPRHRVIAIDLLGFGKSPNPPDSGFTLEEHVQALARTIRSLRLKTSVTLVGHSLGALIGIRYAAENRRRVSHLVLVAPPVYMPANTMIDPVERMQMDAYRWLYDYMRSNQSFTTAGARALSRLSPFKNLLDVDESTWRAFSMSLEKCIESPRTLTDLAQVKVPIDLLYGTRDPFLAPSGLRVIERMRGVSTTRVEGQDHVVRARMAEEIMRVVDNPSPPTAVVDSVTV